MTLPNDTNSTDIDTLTQGAKAARDGMPMTSCPHPNGSRAADYWMAGYILGGR